MITVPKQERFLDGFLVVDITSKSSSSSDVKSSSREGWGELPQEEDTGEDEGENS